MNRTGAKIMKPIIYSLGLAFAVAGAAPAAAQQITFQNTPVKNLCFGLDLLPLPKIYLPRNDSQVVTKTVQQVVASDSYVFFMNA
jgi:hypothetical protein